MEVEGWNWRGNAISSSIRRPGKTTPHCAGAMRCGCLAGGARGQDSQHHDAKLWQGSDFTYDDIVKADRWCAIMNTSLAEEAVDPETAKALVEGAETQNLSYRGKVCPRPYLPGAHYRRLRRGDEVVPPKEDYSEREKPHHYPLRHPVLSADRSV